MLAPLKKANLTPDEWLELLPQEAKDRLLKNCQVELKELDGFFNDPEQCNRVA
jgi:hypothetical protein